MRFFAKTCFLCCCCSTPLFGQVDTLFPNALSWREADIKHYWDTHLADGGDWRVVFDNKKYVLDCKNIFIFEYLARLEVISPNTEIDTNYTLFAHGCKCGNRWVVERGLKKGVNIDRQYQDGSTALILALQSSDEQNVNAILAHSPDISIVNKRRRNALMYAAEKIRDTLIIGALLSKNADCRLKNDWDRNALEEAYYNNNYIVSNFLLKHHLQHYNSEFWHNSRMLEASIHSGDTTLMKIFLPIMDPNRILEKNRIYLKDAEEFTDLYYYLNKYRLDSDETSDTTDLYSTVDLDVAVFKVLSDCGYDLNLTDSLDRNVLFGCRNVEPVIRFLLNKGVPVNQVDRYGYTVLQYFIDEIVTPPRYEFGITLKDKDRDYTPELEFLKLFAEHGALVGKERLNGWAYLYNKAKEKNNIYLLKCLTEHYSIYIK
jgi:ankyrin repeat protein